MQNLNILFNVNQEATVSMSVPWVFPACTSNSTRLKAPCGLKWGEKEDLRHRKKWKTAAQLCVQLRKRCSCFNWIPKEMTLNKVPSYSSLTAHEGKAPVRFGRDSICRTFSCVGCMLHCFFVRPLHQTLISCVHGEGRGRIRVCVWVCVHIWDLIEAMRSCHPINLFVSSLFSRELV